MNRRRGPIDVCADRLDNQHLRLLPRPLEWRHQPIQDANLVGLHLPSLALQIARRLSQYHKPLPHWQHFLSIEDHRVQRCDPPTPDRNQPLVFYRLVDFSDCRDWLVHSTRTSTFASFSEHEPWFLTCSDNIYTRTSGGNKTQDWLPWWLSLLQSAPSVPPSFYILVEVIVFIRECVYCAVAYRIVTAGQTVGKVSEFFDVQSE